MIRAAIFDLWETLATKNVGVSSTLREQFKIPKTPDYTRRYEEAMQLQAWKNENEMAVNFLEAFSLPTSVQNMEHIVSILQTGINRAAFFDGAKELLTALKGRVKLGLLSNTTIFESQGLKRLGVMELFDTTLFSWEIGSLKPAAKNFQAILERLKANPDEAIFIDDGEVNVRAAQELGIRAIRFDGMEKLRHELGELNLLGPQKESDTPREPRG